MGVFKLFKLGDVISKEKATNINPIVLAFVGDAVYSLYVREKLVFSSDCKAGELNKLATKVKKADLKHNSDLTRLDVVDQKALSRREKYLKAIN